VGAGVAVVAGRDRHNADMIDGLPVDADDTVTV
jgi:hypothetical protein